MRLLWSKKRKNDERRWRNRWRLGLIKRRFTIYAMSMAKGWRFGIGLIAAWHGFHVPLIHGDRFRTARPFYIRASISSNCQLHEQHAKQRD